MMKIDLREAVELIKDKDMDIVIEDDAVDISDSFMNPYDNLSEHMFVGMDRR